MWNLDRDKIDALAVDKIECYFKHFVYPSPQLSRATYRDEQCYALVDERCRAQDEPFEGCIMWYKAEEEYGKRGYNDGYPLCKRFRLPGTTFESYGDCLARERREALPGTGLQGTVYDRKGSSLLDSGRGSGAVEEPREEQPHNEEDGLFGPVETPIDQVEICVLNGPKDRVLGEEAKGPPSALDQGSMSCLAEGMIAMRLKRSSRLTSMIIEVLIALR